MLLRPITLKIPLIIFNILLTRRDYLRGVRRGLTSSFVDPMKFFTSHRTKFKLQINSNRMRKLYLTVTLFLVTALAFAQPAETPTKVVTDNGGAGTGTVTWSSDTVYILEGRVFVNEGDVLTIEAGTVIKGRSSEDPQNASVLVVARGGQIFAEGTADAPIIFTAESDDVTVPGDVQAFDRGLWGGVIVLGRASTNRGDNEGQIEGIEGDARGAYGGTDDADNSGVLTYISIRHGGIAIAPDNEINGLTLGAVGTGTTIEYIEVFANQDDGVEWFGGTVNTKYLSVSFCGDDSFDYDEGFRGKGQFWFTIQDNEGDRGGEHDGGTDPETGEPFATPVVYNSTFLGPDNPEDESPSRAITFRDNAGGQYWNSIFADFNQGIDIEELESGTHSFDRFVAGELALAGNIFFNIEKGDVADSLFTVAGSPSASSAATFVASFESNGNTIDNPQFASVTPDSRLAAQELLDPRPAVGGPAYTGLQSATDPFFETVSYKGAFGANPNTWVHGWTALDAYGFLAPSEGEEIVITDDGSGTGTTTWMSNNTYILDGRVFVNEGDTLTIQAGTVIKGRASADPQNAAVLVVARGGYIDAQGTADLPIIFTAESDDVTIPDDVTPFERGLWGGVIILGNASTNRGDTEGQIEGIEGDVRGTYGGTDDADNSGIFRYVSIRHGGVAIAPDNEINGLTLGAVGTGTTIEYVEVFANQDDGVEWFGGTVNTKYLAVAYCGDDSYDYDEGFRGFGQYWFTIQDDEGDRGGEHDGGTDPETGEPFAIPRVFNATYMGAANADEESPSRIITFRDNAGGMYRNSIFADFTRGMDIEFLASGTHSYDRFTNGDLVIENNLFWNIAAGTTGDALITLGGDDDENAAAVVAGAFDAGNNVYNNPVFAAWNENSRTPGAEAFDPRPAAGGFAYRDLADTPDNGIIDNVAFKGAFGEDLWVEGWTAMDAYGFLGQEGGNSNPDTLAVEGETIVVTDNAGEGTGTTTWTSNNTYILDGRVFVNEGDTLTIEPGTVIKGRPSADPQNASVLVVARGAYIDAQGTAAAPIIFTAEADDVTIPDDVTPFERGLWGGVIVLGNASTNRGENEGQIEGIEGDARGTYGGDNDEDNSGILTYISIRHGGIAIAPDNEINGLTLGGVGSGTTIEHIEVFANQDDGVEWFGGTVNTKYLSVAFCGDDSYDYDEGFRGKGQFWFTIQDDEGDRGGEHDGGTDPETGEPFAIPRVFNATYFGSGNPEDESPSRTITFRDNAGGMYKNSIFSDFNSGIDIENLASGTHSYDRFQAEELQLTNNVFWNNDAGSTGAELFTIGGDADEAASADVAAAFAEGFNIYNNPLFAAINENSRTPGAAAFDPRPSEEGFAFGGAFAEVPEDGFYEAVNYKGAFGDDLWVEGWTALDAYGFLGQEGGNSNTDIIAEEIVVTDAEGAGTGSTTWTRNNTYILEGRVFVNEGDTLRIEAGTVIKGRSSADPQNASVLVVARGGYIIACGTAEDPIIFTAESDDVTVADDVTPFERGLWGGVIVLGNASTNRGDTEGQIEGIEGDARGTYGGTDDEDDSGILKYISIRHGGIAIAPDNEINGLTLGGVGRGTTIEYIEVFANQDDGVEWFGGTVNTKYLSVAFCGDDSYDYDEGFRGFGQYWFTIQDDEGDRGGEHDGGTDPETGEPFALPRVFNATYMGAANPAEESPSRIITFRDNAGGMYKNSIFADFTRGIDVEFLESGTHSYDRQQAGELALENNLFWNIDAGTTGAELFTIGGDTNAVASATFAAYFDSASNAWDNPSFIADNENSRTPGAMALDPRPSSRGAAFEDFAETPDNGFHDQVDFKGAFSPSDDLWVAGWTALDAYGFLGQDGGNPNGSRPLTTALVQIIHNSPDPAVEFVDVYVDSVLALDDFEFRTATGFLEFPFGSYDIGFALSNSESADDIVLNFPGIQLDSAKYVVIANGVLDTTLCGSNTVNGSATAFGLAVLTPAENDAPEGQVNVTVFHGSPSAPPVDAVIRGLPVVAVDDLAYGEFQGPALQPAADLPLNITPADDNNTVLTEITAPLGSLNGSAVVVFASGFFACDSLAPLGFFAALPDGTVVDLSGTPTSIVDKFDAIQGFNLYPNPVLGSLNVEAENLDAQNVEISIFDMLGNRVMRTAERPVAGKLNVSFDLSTLAPAMYMVRVSQGQKMSVKPILVN